MMFKILFFVLLSLASSGIAAKVEMKWLTVASVLLDDGETKILFDPAFTRPTWRHWLALEAFKSNEVLVDRVMRAQSFIDVRAVFVSHSHFDHAVDAPMVAKLSGATFHADAGAGRIAVAYKDEKIKTQLLEAGKVVEVGKFSVTPLLGEHSKLMQLFEFLPGEVKEGFDFDFYDYRMGRTWVYLIKHAEGTILLSPGTGSMVQVEKVDVLIQSVAGRESDESILNGPAKSLGPKLFVPNHFDNFLIEFNPSREKLLPGVELDGLMDKMKKAFPAMKLERPVFGQKMVILEV